MQHKVKIVFIIGLARSGTKLLRDILNNHSQIAIFPMETQFIPKLHKSFSDLDLSDPDIFHRFYLAFLDSVYAINVRKSGGNLPSEKIWHDGLKTFSFSEILRRFYELSLLIEKPNAYIVGDKTPRYTGHVDLLLKIFSDALFVHIVRDPRDRALSEKQVWGKSLCKSVRDWCLLLEHLQTQIQAAPGAFLQLRYEDLLLDANKQLRRITDFLGLSWQENMAQLQHTSEHYGNARGARRIVKANQGKYRLQLSEPYIKRLEQISYPMLKQYGYRIDYAQEHKPLSDVLNKVLAIINRIKLCRFHVREKGFVEGWRYFRRISD